MKCNVITKLTFLFILRKFIYVYILHCLHFKMMYSFIFLLSYVKIEQHMTN